MKEELRGKKERLEKKITKAVQDYVDILIEEENDIETAMARVIAIVEHALIEE